MTKKGETYLDWHQKRCVHDLQNETAAVYPPFTHLAPQHHGESVSKWHLRNLRSWRHFDEGGEAKKNKKQINKIVLVVLR